MKNVVFAALHEAIKRRGLEVLEIHEDREDEFCASYFHPGKPDNLYVDIMPDHRDTFYGLVSYLKNYEEDDTPLGTFVRYYYPKPALIALWVNLTIDKVLSGEIAHNLEDQFN